MYILPVNSLSPGMTLYEDVYSNDKILLLKANTRLTQEKIEFLIEKHIDSVPLAEPLEVEQSRYEHLHNNEHFQRFNAIYDDAIASFVKKPNSPPRSALALSSEYFSANLAKSSGFCLTCAKIVSAFAF